MSHMGAVKRGAIAFKRVLANFIMIGWDGTEESRRIIETMLDWLPSRTIAVSDS